MEVGMRRTKTLISDIVAMGRARGLTAADLAARAGISPSNLSRIRTAGRFNADTLERLLGAVDGMVEVRPRAPRRTARTLDFVARKLDAGRREQLGTARLRRLLTHFRASAAADRAFSHLIGIIEEVPIEQIHDLVIEGDASLRALKRIADFVGGEGPTVAWIDEQLSSAGSHRRPA